MADVIRQPCDEGVIRSKVVRSACTPNTAPWLLVATIIGSSMAFIDETALPVALPAIQDGLGATAVDVTISSGCVRAPSIASSNPDVVLSPDASAIVASGSDDPELSVIIVAPIPELNVPSSKMISVSPI